MHIYADPCHEDTVYVLNSLFMKSTDGGKTFASIPVPHIDTAWLYQFVKSGQGELRYEIRSGFGRMDILLTYKANKSMIREKITYTD